jgi:SAM-dependent methyltransferase
MTRGQMEEAAARLSAEAGAGDNLHGYFLMHAERLFETAQRFGLWSRPSLGDVLEIGPFYGYMPFFLRERASSFTVLEGDDPAVHRLQPLYAQHKIDLHLVDLFDSFGSVVGAPNLLPLPDRSFDTILCWETMEHFNFNPVKFVRDLFRLLKPGGTACITVPNRASLQNLVLLATGHGETRSIDSYLEFADYQAHGKNVFYGFHWHEYTEPELADLFRRTGFGIEASGTLFVNQGNKRIGPARRVLRAALRSSAALLPRFGTTVYLRAVRPA